MTKHDFGAINDATAFAEGDRFTSESQVREYFSVESQVSMFGETAVRDQDLLDQWAEVVISSRWHFEED